MRIPQLEIMVDYTRAALYGLQPQAITEQLERLSNGRVVSRLVDGTRRFDVVMRLNDSQRTTQGLGDLLLETPYGWVPVRQIAEIREGDGPNQILRENGKRRVVVLANADGSANMARLIADIRRELAATQLPQGCLHVARGHVPGAGRGEPHHRAALAAFAGDDLCHSLQPLPLGGARSRSSWAACRSP